MKYLPLFLLLLTGCAHNQPMQQFPNPPELLMKQPLELQTLPNDQLILSNTTESIVKNYIISNKNKQQLISLQEWIKSQQELFNKSNH